VAKTIRTTDYPKPLGAVKSTNSKQTAGVRSEILKECPALKTQSFRESGDDRERGAICQSLDHSFPLNVTGSSRHGFLAM
jgi:hypothetical protein